MVILPLTRSSKIKFLPVISLMNFVTAARSTSTKLNVASRDFFVSPYELPAKHIRQTRVVITARLLNLLIPVSICKKSVKRQATSVPNAPAAGCACSVPMHAQRCTLFSCVYEKLIAQ